MDRRGIEPRFPGCKPGVFPFDEQPGLESPKSKVQRPKSERQKDRGRRRLLFSDLGLWTLDFGPSPLGELTEVGVEPTKSRRSRHRRFAGLRTRPFLHYLLRSISSRSGCRTRPVELMRPHWALAPLRHRVK
jgi:hypothetical protein